MNDLTFEEETDTEVLYQDALGIAGELCAKHTPLAVAAVLNAVSLNLYKTFLSLEEYESMMDTIDSNTHNIKSLHTTKSLH